MIASAPSPCAICVASASTPARPGPGARTPAPRIISTASGTSPARSLAMSGSYPAAECGVSASGLVSISARRVIRPGAQRRSSIATMPPIESPARAKRAGRTSSSAAPIASIRAPPVMGATVTARSRLRSAICGAKSRASHIMPGRKTTGSLLITSLSPPGLSPLRRSMTPARARGKPYRARISSSQPVIAATAAGVVPGDRMSPVMTWAKGSSLGPRSGARRVTGPPHCSTTLSVRSGRTT